MCVGNEFVRVSLGLGPGLLFLGGSMDKYIRKWHDVCYSNVDRHLLVALAVVTFAVVVADFVVVTVVVVLREVVVNFAV